MVFLNSSGAVRVDARRAALRATVSDGGIGESMLDELFDVLSDRRRRYALYHLDDEGGASTREAIVDSVVDRETAEGDRPNRERVLAELHHVHLPRLHDAGFVDYDRESGGIALERRFDRVERFVDLARAEENADA